MPPAFEVQVTVGDLFGIEAFRRSTHGLEEEGTTFSLNLESDFAPLYVKLYPLKSVHTQLASLLMELKIESTRFVDQGMTPVLKCSPSYSIEAGHEGDLYYQQVVALAQPNQWWIARLASKLNHPDYYLLHWVGISAHAELVVSAMASFKLLDSTGRGRDI